MFTNDTQGLSLCPYLALEGDLCVCETVVCVWDVVVFHTPAIWLSTTYCLAAGIAGGWHLLLECCWCGRDLWIKKRPVGVRGRCLGLQCCALIQTLCDTMYVSTTFAERRNYVGGDIFTQCLMCVRYTTVCSGERPVVLRYKKNL